MHKLRAAEAESFTDLGRARARELSESVDEPRRKWMRRASQGYTFTLLDR